MNLRQENDRMICSPEASGLGGTWSILEVHSARWTINLKNYEWTTLKYYQIPVVLPGHRTRGDLSRVCTS